LTKPPLTNIQDSGGLNSSTEIVIIDPFTEPKGYYSPCEENETMLTDEADQSKRKDTELGSSSDDDYEECTNDGSSELVETNLSLNQSPSSKPQEPSLSGDIASQQTLTSLSPKKPPDSEWGFTVNVEK